MGKRGPKPLPTNIKVLRGNPGKRPLHPEDEPDFGGVVPDPPDFLRDEALQEWQRVAPALAANQLITVPDRAALAGYCQSYARWAAAERLLNEHRKENPEGDGIETGTGRFPLGTHPAVKVAREALADVIRYAGEFGMTPSARTKVQAKKKEKKNPFEGHGKPAS